MRSSRQFWEDWEDAILLKHFADGFKVSVARKLMSQLPGRSPSGMENRVFVLKRNGQIPSTPLKQASSPITPEEIEVIKAVSLQHPELGWGNLLARHLIAINALPGREFNQIRLVLRRTPSPVPALSSNGRWRLEQDAALALWVDAHPDAAASTYWANIARSEVPEIAMKSTDSVRNRLDFYVKGSEGDDEVQTPVPQKFIDKLPKTLTPGQREMALSIATYDRPSAKRYAEFCVENEKLLPQVA